MPDRPRYVATAPLDAGELPAFAGGTAMSEDAQLMDEIKYDDRGLIPAIVQDADTDRVLMLAYMNRDSLELTLRSRQTNFWSRSRQEPWHKGATSGNVQHVVDVRLDCDGDTLLVRVRPAGPACHTGQTTCFYRFFPGDEDDLAGVLGDGSDAF